MTENENEAIDAAVLDQLAQDIGLETLPLLVDKLVAEMAPRTKSILEATLHQNADLVAREAHILKSTTASFGALQISACARQMEELAHKKDWEQLTPIAARLPLLMMAAVEGIQK